MSSDSGMEGNGILVFRGNDVVITGNTVANNNQSNTARDGIRIAGQNDGTARWAQNILVTGNRAYDDQPTKTQEWGIKLNDLGGQRLVNHVVIADNIVAGNSLGGVSLAGLVAGGDATVRNNLGHATEVAGSAVIPGGLQSVAVDHGLAFTPDLSQVTVTPTNDLGASAKFWVSAVDSTSLTIDVDADPGAAGASFVWRIRR